MRGSHRSGKSQEGRGDPGVGARGWERLSASERLSSQLEFLVEVDRLKEITRQTDLMSGNRKENSAEHCWHLAMMAMVLSEHHDGDIDLPKVMQMVLLHDVVEIDAGDTFCYDEEGAKNKTQREMQAADRLFGLLPRDQGERFRALWEEFERGESPEARFAAALDRVMPLLHNYFTQGGSWEEHGIVRSQVMERSGPIQRSSQSLWELTLSVVDEAVRCGYLSE